MTEINDAEAAQPSILVVDDEPSLVALVRTMLWRAGYSVFEAYSGEEALRVAGVEGRHIDVLLTDVMMPGMNGFELAGKLQAMRPELKVLFMSGYRDRVIAESTGVSAGISPLLRKPFTQYTLVTMIGDLLAGAGLQT